MFATIMLLVALTGAAQEHAPAGAEPQEHAAPGAEAHGAEGAAGGHGEEFDILHHIQDSQEIELPFGTVIHLPEKGSWMVGPVDMTPTKHVVFLGLTGLIVLALLLTAGSRASAAGPTVAPRKGHNVIEATVLFLRDQIVMPNIGHGGEKFAPFVITL